MSTELTALPSSFAAGTTITYRKSFSDYPAGSGWTLTLYLRGASAADIEAEADGDDFVVTIEPTDTGKGFAAGLYRWSERVSTEAGEVHEVGAGRVNILPDLGQAGAGTNQEWLERAVAALRAHIEGRIAAGMESYQIGGRVVSKIPLLEARKLLAKLETDLVRLQYPGTVGQNILLRFGPLE